MSLAKVYDASATEKRWYQHWLDRNYFHSEPDDREPYTIVIPPPNVTGVLHMGHMLNNTIQDILIRKARLEGKNACWVPGTDHASIATEAKVVRMLRERNIKKGELSREEFLDYAWEWKEEYGGIILNQLQKLGASCDWERTRFTMEDSLYRAAIKVFVDLFRKGKLYRGLRMTNWDPVAQTVLSNEEVIYRDENSALYHVRYRVVGTDDEYVVIATQRPETIMADTGLAVHPDDERYQHLHGKQVVVPLVDRPVPVIADTYVDPEFGTGALKITPAHDPNDYEIGQKHGLEVIDTINPDGTLNELAQFAVGQDRFEARKEIVRLLKESGALVDVTQYRTRIGLSERTEAVVEPRLTLQWFLKMDEFAATALRAVESGEVRFFPESMWNMFNSWLKEENVRDWCVSRQLWWGQRIPAWYLTDPASGEEIVIVEETDAAALAAAREKTGNPDLTLADLHQDEDVLDTWMSSWLWPISVFDGFDRQDELRYYYPTNVLVTGWDIMFFWVARMIMAGYEYSPELLGEGHAHQPFNDVYFTGMVRDSKRRKMSKSLGNSPDALELIDRYGADGVRFGMLSSGAAGNDIIFDAPIDPKTGKVHNESKLCEQGRNFCNKMWNALRLIKSFEVSAADPDPVAALAGRWMTARLNQTIADLDRQIGGYRLSDALMTLYKSIWDDFCSWYLEMIKPGATGLSRQTQEQAVALFERMMVLLHPFMPFVTEEIWHQLRDRAAGEDCIVAQWPAAAAYDQGLIDRFELLKQAVTSVREARSSKGIKMRDPLHLLAPDTEAVRSLFAEAGLVNAVEKMAYLAELRIDATTPDNAVSLLIGNDTYYLELNQAIDTSAEREKLTEELKYYQGFLQSVEKKLGNERFVSNAPAAVVDKERQKQSDAKNKIASLEEALSKL